MRLNLYYAFMWEKDDDQDMEVGFVAAENIWQMTDLVESMEWDAPESIQVFVCCAWEYGKTDLEEPKVITGPTLTDGFHPPEWLSLPAYDEHVVYWRRDYPDDVDYWTNVNKLHDAHDEFSFGRGDYEPAQP